MGTYAAKGQEADDLIAEQASVIESLGTQVSTLEAELAEATERAVVAELKYDQHMKDVHGDPVPPPIVTRTVVGSSLQTGDFEVYASRCGGLESTRSFSSPGKMPTSLTAAGVGSSVGKRLIVHSFKGRVADINQSCQSLISGADDSWLNAFFDSLPLDAELDVIWRHEPDEEGVNAKTWSDAQWKMRRLVDAANTRRLQKGKAKKILFGCNLMTWSVQKVPARIANIYPGDGCWDFGSWDGYTNKAGTPGKNETGETMFKEAVAWNKAHGNLPFAIGEFGSGGGVTADRAAFIKDVCDYAKSVNALFVNYWNSLTADGDYRLSAKDEKVLGDQTK